MRILLYNFVQPDQPGAGGAGSYLNGLARALADKGHEVVAMSSGVVYSALGSKPRLRFTRDRFARVLVVNSPVLAPARFSFAVPDAFNLSRELDFVPALLRRKLGDIEVFHFHNLEGLTRSFFVELRRVFPAARVIYSAHNYNLVCPMVTLWRRDREPCEDYRAGRSCTDCQAAIHSPAAVRAARRLAPATQAIPVGRSRGTRPPGRFAAARGLVSRAGPWLASRRAPATVPASGADAYARFREGNVELCRTVFDKVLAVSERAREVLVRSGVPREKVALSYIGTRNKALFLTSKRITDIGSGLHIAYLGYMSREKGFRFMLEVLERMPRAVAANSSLTIAAERTDPEAYSRLMSLRERYRSVRYHDGYGRSELPAILDGVNLGLVPALWEDNLPQVAIELVARGIPLLTSDRGGAQEVFTNREFVFEAGSHSDLIDRLVGIAEGRIDIGSFWEGPFRLFSMEEHVAHLERHYAGRPIYSHLAASMFEANSTAMDAAEAAE